MDQHMPWYKRSKDVQPYSLFRSIATNRPNKQPYYCSAVFPWDNNSLKEVYKGSGAEDVKLQAEWSQMVDKWTGAILVGSTGCFHVIHKFGCGKSTTLSISKPREWKRSWNVRCVAWAIASNGSSHPVAIAAVSSVLFVVDLNSEKPKIIGRIRGHGDDITSIAVNPHSPYQFLTTSKDGTTRMYDLTYTPRQTPNNPHWPPQPPDIPSVAGPAFGLHLSEPEGEGLGRCIAVLVGGLSGGHNGAVFCATWHPSADLIATCGMDRAVKIWRVPFIDYDKVEQNEEHLAREDKPLFSTDLIHKARVLSITWLTRDILVSHSAPALMRGESLEDMYNIPGTIDVWKWLGFNRYLPDGSVKKVMRGGLQDFRRSDSFKLMAEYPLPMPCRVLTFAPMIPLRRNPQVLVDDGNFIRIFNLSEFRPKMVPPFPLDEPDQPARLAQDDTEARSAGDEEPELVDGLETMDLDGEKGEETGEDDEEDDEEYFPAVVYRRELLATTLVQNVPHWAMPKDVKGGTISQPTVASLDRWQIAFDGQLLVGVSENGTLSMWKLNHA